MIPVWVICGIYGLMTESIFTRETNRPCHLSEDPNSMFGRISVIFSIVLPVVIGPVLTVSLYCGILLLSCSVRSLKGKCNSDQSVMEDVCCLTLMVSHP